MGQLLAETTEVSTWLTADLAVMGVSIASFVVVGLWWMGRHATLDHLDRFDGYDRRFHRFDFLDPEDSVSD